jgi:hypothetical protein
MIRDAAARYVTEKKLTRRSCAAEMSEAAKSAPAAKVAPAAAKAAPAKK